MHRRYFPTSSYLAARDCDHDAVLLRDAVLVLDQGRVSSETVTLADKLRQHADRLVTAAHLLRFEHTEPDLSATARAAVDAALSYWVQTGPRRDGTIIYATNAALVVLRADPGHGGLAEAKRYAEIAWEMAVRLQTAMERAS